jgi:hypothetical protein
MFKCEISLKVEIRVGINGLGFFCEDSKHSKAPFCQLCSFAGVIDRLFACIQSVRHTATKRVAVLEALPSLGWCRQQQTPATRSVANQTIVKLGRQEVGFTAPSAVDLTQGVLNWQMKRQQTKHSLFPT